MYLDFTSLEAFVNGLPPLAVVAIVVGAITVQVVLAILAALKRRQFNWDELAKFLESRVLRYVVALGAMAMLINSTPDWEIFTRPLFYAGALFVLRYLGAKAGNDVLFLLGFKQQLPVPDLPPPPDPTPPALPDPSIVVSDDPGA